MARTPTPEEREFGFSLVEELLTEQFTAGLSAQEVFPQNPNRVTLLIGNASPNDVAIGRTPSVSVATGIRVPPNGGAVSLDVLEDGALVRSRWFVIASSAGTVLSRYGTEKASPPSGRSSRQEVEEPG